MWKVRCESTGSSASTHVDRFLVRVELGGSDDDGRLYFCTLQWRLGKTSAPSTSELGSNINLS